jgi:endonuclease YncB( thermonuclease family)
MADVTLKARSVMKYFFHPMVVLCWVLLSAGVSSAELHSYALIQDDASLRISGKRVHLHGIYIPPTERQCQTHIRPVRCASRAVLALAFKVQGFVHCYPQSENSDGTLNAFCYVNRSAFDAGEDLGAYLISEGWALAGAGAPFEYSALERIAEKHNRGVWGLRADQLR